MQARDRAGQKVVLVLQNEVAHAQAPDQGAVLARIDSGITSMSQLGGKTIGYLSIGNQYSATVHDVLMKHGVDPKTCTKSKFRWHKCKAPWRSIPLTP